MIGLLGCGALWQGDGPCEPDGWSIDAGVTVLGGGGGGCVTVHMTLGT